MSIGIPNTHTILHKHTHTQPHTHTHAYTHIHTQIHTQPHTHTPGIGVARTPALIESKVYILY